MPQISDHRRDTKHGNEPGQMAKTFDVVVRETGERRVPEGSSLGVLANVVKYCSSLATDHEIKEGLPVH
jgi:hypothetical protein